MSEQPDVDYRMSFAAERTYLAYLRTGLALIAAGVAVAGALPGAGVEDLRRGVGLGLVALGGVTVAGARLRWRAVTAAMQAGLPLPRSAVSDLLAVALVLTACAAAVVVVLV